MTLVAQAVALHVPWWIWAIAAVGLVGSIWEQQQRAQRKTKHRAYLHSPQWKATRRDALVS